MNSDYSLILATDLDGTFLGGSAEQKAEFYQYVQSNRDRILLVFVTGRDLDFIDGLCQDPSFPAPDYIIGDVGTTIVNWPSRQPLDAVQDWVANTWGQANDRVKEMMANEPGIELQPVMGPYRVSYFYKPDQLQQSTVQKVIDAGFDCILSADLYLDVMPKGISKGPTLLRFIEALSLSAEDVIPAGDTLNDLSLFETGLKGIAVGNAEPKLVDRIKDMENVYHSSHPGVAGIWDGLKTYGKH
ncbi:HAD-superfamily hydrolase, subfamily IIB [Thalassoporum mexicanum PCC 7367]|uniref:HAD-IIB family hydrolase n=1 Tax=Thalassoporum mexicanum TaxID=3457544 RepID=UPI00029FAFB0|nr:HAD-IIB family hydrolase [Pseudanabaena sp. PCC 7367]AFY69136.1 HAD-superfamily hydrolase, subfamily IIB [Pseudanabaena sp. PCC 7367]